MQARKSSNSSRSLAVSASNAARAADACPPCARIASTIDVARPSCRKWLRHAPQRHRAEFAAARRALTEPVGQTRAHVVQQQIGVEPHGGPAAQGRASPAHGRWRSRTPRTARRRATPGTPRSASADRSCRGTRPGWAQLVGAPRVHPHKHYANYPPQKDRRFARAERDDVASGRGDSRSRRVHIQGLAINLEGLNASRLKAVEAMSVARKSATDHCCRGC